MPARLTSNIVGSKMDQSTFANELDLRQNVYSLLMSCIICYPSSPAKHQSVNKLLLRPLLFFLLLILKCIFLTVYSVMIKLNLSISDFAIVFLFLMLLGTCCRNTLFSVWRFCIRTKRMMLLTFCKVQVCNSENSQFLGDANYRNSMAETFRLSTHSSTKSYQKWPP